MSSPSGTVFWIENCVHTNTDIYFLYIKKKISGCILYVLMDFDPPKKSKYFYYAESVFHGMNTSLFKMLVNVFFVIGWRVHKTPQESCLRTF